MSRNFTKEEMQMAGKYTSSLSSLVTRAVNGETAGRLVHIPEALLKGRQEVQPRQGWRERTLAASSHGLVGLKACAPWLGPAQASLEDWEDGYSSIACNREKQETT